MELRKAARAVDVLLQRHRGKSYHLEVKINPNVTGDYVEFFFNKSDGNQNWRGSFQLTNTLMASMTPLALLKLLEAKVDDMGELGFATGNQLKERKQLSPVDEWLEEYDRRDTTTHGKA